MDSTLSMSADTSKDRVNKSFVSPIIEQEVDLRQLDVSKKQKVRDCTLELKQFHPHLANQIVKDLFRQEK